jgi:hypothetical protein
MVHVPIPIASAFRHDVSENEDFQTRDSSEAAAVAA